MARVLPLFYIISIASLVAVDVFGKKYLGARRWVQIGSFHFQPSEWVKLVLILAMAKYFSDNVKGDADGQDLVKAGCSGRRSHAHGAGAARPWHRAHLPAYRDYGIVPRRYEATSCTGGVGDCWLAGAGGLAFLKPYQRDRLTAYADRGRLPRQGLSGDSVSGCGGLGRNLREGNGTGQPDAGPESAVPHPTSSSLPLPRSTAL